MRFYLLSTSFLCCCLTALYGQSPDALLQQDSPIIIPPSPNATALAKFADMPPSLYNGIASESIPLHTIQFRDISLPISLDYHASGIKVEEVGSWVGLGWALNAGGVITRDVLKLRFATFQHIGSRLHR